jgi:hypothetical protein
MSHAGLFNAEDAQESGELQTTPVDILSALRVSPRCKNNP